MKKLALCTALAMAMGMLVVALQPATVQADAAPCVRTKFDTKLTEEACKKGGQEEAKKAWKAWVAEAKKADATMACKTCHDKMAPNFEVKKEALDVFKKAGGK